MTSRLLIEKKWLKHAVHPSKKGMFKGRSEESLESQESKLKASGPHKAGSADATKERELSFAIRAKKHHGFKEEVESSEAILESMTPLEAHNILLQTSSYGKDFSTLTDDRIVGLLHYAEQVGYYKQFEDTAEKAKAFHEGLSKLASELSELTEETGETPMVSLVELAQNKNAVQFQGQLYTRLQTKVQEQLNAEKSEIAQYMFGDIELSQKDIALGEGLFDSDDALLESQIGFSKLRSELGSRGAEDPTAIAMAIIRRLNEYMSCEPTYKFKETPVDGEGALYNKPGTAYLAPGHLHAPDGDPAHEANKGGFRASDVSVHRMPEPTHGGGNIFGKTIPSEDRKTRSFREPVEHKDGGTGGVNSGT